nr:MAG TPA: hypothetical protein [Bacteriophage sp.]
MGGGYAVACTRPPQRRHDRRFSLYGGMGCAVAVFGVYSNDSGGGCCLWGCFWGCDSAITFCIMLLTAAARSAAKG